MSYIMRWGMYILSYLPLYFLLIVKHLKDIETLKKQLINGGPESYFWGALVILLSLSIFFASILIFQFTKSGIPKILRIDYKKIQPLRDQEMSYLITYVVPLASIQDISDDKLLITNLILFILIGLMYTKNSMIHVNPFYSLIGLNVYQYEDSSYITFMSIEKFKDLIKNQYPVQKKNWTSNVYFISKKNDA